MVVVIYAVVCYLLYSGNMSRQVTTMLVSISCYIVLAVSLNLVVGLLGELSLGHAGFMSVGLFTGCLVSLATVEVLPLPLRLPRVHDRGRSGCRRGGSGGRPAGTPAQGRLPGHRHAGCAVRSSRPRHHNLDVTGGAKGLNTTPIYGNAKDPPALLHRAGVLVIIVMMNLKSSRHGRAIMAIRDNRIAAESNGVDITYYKLMVFILAAFFAGMAGTIYGHSLSNNKAASFDYNMSIEILVLVVLGGMGSIRGSIIATIILRALPEALRVDWVSDYRMLAYSVLLIVIMLLNASPKFADLKGRWSIGNVIYFVANQKKQKEAAHRD